jgi:enoyl-CoA hydratase/carnithine racemase
MSYEHVIYEKKDRIAYVTINRPEVMNAINAAAHVELREIWEDFRDDDDVWVAIFTGAGDRAFSTGNDLKESASRDEKARNAERPPFAGMTSKFECSKPIIAAVHGYCVAGGFETALACDLIVAADNTQFSLPEEGRPRRRRRWTASPRADRTTQDDDGHGAHRQADVRRGGVPARDRQRGRAAR